MVNLNSWTVGFETIHKFIFNEHMKLYIKAYMALLINHTVWLCDPLWYPLVICEQVKMLIKKFFLINVIY